MSETSPAPDQKPTDTTTKIKHLIDPAYKVSFIAYASLYVGGFVVSLIPFIFPYVPYLFSLACGIVYFGSIIYMFSQLAKNKRYLCDELKATILTIIVAVSFSSGVSEYGVFQRTDNHDFLITACAFFFGTAWWSMLLVCSVISLQTRNLDRATMLTRTRTVVINLVKIGFDTPPEFRTNEQLSMLQECLKELKKINEMDVEDKSIDAATLTAVLARLLVKNKPSNEANTKPPQ